MGLFSNNKKLCPVCGNPTPRLLATKIQDTPICKECDKKIYLPKGRTDRMTIDDFKQYIQFYEDNQALRDQFEENYSFNFGLFGGDLVLDIFHGLFRVNCDKDSLAFQADNLKSFRILEDSRVLFEGNHQELKHYDSKVPEKVKQLEPQIAQFQMQMREYEMFERLERMHEENDKDDNHYHEYHPRPSFDVASPADTFHVELTFDHPYWDNIMWDWTGVSFDSDSPSVEAFLSCYEDKTESLHTLALNLAHLMNPNVKEMTAGEKNRLQSRRPDLWKSRSNLLRAIRSNSCRSTKVFWMQESSQKKNLQRRKSSYWEFNDKADPERVSLIYEICKNNFQMVR